MSNEELWLVESMENYRENENVLEIDTKEQDLKDLLLLKQQQLESMKEKHQAELEFNKMRYQEELNFQKGQYQINARLQEQRHTEQLKIKEETIAQVSKRLYDSRMQLSIAEDKMNSYKQKILALEHQSHKGGSIQEICFVPEGVWSKFTTAIRKHNIEVSEHARDLLSLKFHHLLRIAMARYADENNNASVLYKLIESMETLILTSTKNHLEQTNTISINGEYNSLDLGHMLYCAIDTSTLELLLVKSAPPTGTEVLMADFFASQTDVPDSICVIKKMNQPEIPKDESTSERSTLGHSNNFVYLSMKRMISSLTELPKCPEEYLLAQGKRIKNALDYLHAHGYVHMDVKNTNIVINEKADWFLIDFDATVRVNSRIIKYTKQYYPSPIQEVPAMPELDLFALGVTLVMERMKNTWRENLYVKSQLSFERLYNSVRNPQYFKLPELQDFVEKLLQNWTEIERKRNAICQI